MKKYFFIPLFFVLLGCGEHSFDNFSNMLDGFLSSSSTNSSSSRSNISQGLVPNTVIPDDVKSKVEDKMPIYSGITPPDISGKYIVSRLIMIGSSLDEDRDSVLTGGSFVDLYIAFNKKSDRIFYRSKEGDLGYGNSDSVAVDVVGEGNNFTAYFIEVGQTNDINTKRSVVISGTITSSGIEDFYYSFILLEKGSDPEGKLVPVKTYRIFKDKDGLSERYDWSY
jgi:hypothetical protein